MNGVYRWLSITVLPLALAIAACQAPAAEQTSAAPAKAQTAAAAKLFIAADVVQGSKNLTDAEKPSRSCVLTSRFPRNAEIVWRIRVGDPETGAYMDKAALSKVEVRLANGKDLDAQYGPHPKDPPGESFWTASWVVPKDHPTSMLDYTIVATDTKGRTGEWKPFSTKPSLLTIIDQVLPDVPTAPAAPAKPKA